MSTIYILPKQKSLRDISSEKNSRGDNGNDEPPAKKIKTGVDVDQIKNELSAWWRSKIFDRLTANDILIHKCMKPVLPCLNLGYKLGDDVSAIRKRLQKLYRGRVLSVNPMSSCTVADEGNMFHAVLSSNGITSDYRLRMISDADEELTRKQLLHTRPLRGCNFAKLNIRIHTNTENTVKHSCPGRGICWCINDFDKHEKVISDTIPVFICRKTGNVHVCGNFCDAYESTNHEGFPVCELTGEVLTDLVLAPTFPQLPERHVFNPLAKNIPKRMLQDGLEETNEKALMLTMSKQPFEPPPPSFLNYDAVMTHVFVYMLNIFAQWQDDCDQEYNNAQQEKSLEIMKSQFRAGRAPGTHVNAHNMVRTMASHDAKTFLCPRFSWTPEIRVKLAGKYACKILNMWYVLIQYCKIPFNELQISKFIVPALWVLSNGVVVDSVAVIPKDSLIRLLTTRLSNRMNTKQRNRGGKSDVKKSRWIEHMIRNSGVRPDLLDISRVKDDDIRNLFSDLSKKYK